MARADLERWLPEAGISYRWEKRLGGFRGLASEVAPLHVHHADDEAWHVVSGALLFRFADEEVVAGAGSTVLVPAGVAHTFGNSGPGPSRYIIILPARLDELISALHEADRAETRWPLVRKDRVTTQDPFRSQRPPMPLSHVCVPACAPDATAGKERVPGLLRFSTATAAYPTLPIPCRARSSDRHPRGDATAYRVPL